MWSSVKRACAAGCRNRRARRGGYHPPAICQSKALIACLPGNPRGRAGSSRPTDSCHDHHDISEAWHRRRPGGPSRYSAAAFRACRVIPMRAARGAASSAQATDRSLPGRPESSFPPLGLLSPPNPLRWASAGAPVTASASQWGGRQCTPGLCKPDTAHRRHEPPFWGSRGRSPWPFFPPISSGRNGGARRAGAPREGAPPMNGRPQVAPTDDQSLTLAKPGDHGRMISAPTGPAMVSRTRY